MKYAGGEMETAYVSVPKHILTDLVKKTEELESIVETLEILLDEKTMGMIKQSENDIAEGRVEKLASIDDLEK